MPETPAPTPPSGPRSIAGEADRERLLCRLREYFALGQLDLDDMSRRVGVVLASTYIDEAAQAVRDLPQLAGMASAESAPDRSGRPRLGQRRRHAQRMAPAEGWVPTSEMFRDPSTRAITRVWIDPGDLSRHYVPEPDR